MSDDHYFRLQTTLAIGNDEMDDASPSNTRALLLKGEDLVSDAAHAGFFEDALALPTLALTQERSRGPMKIFVAGATGALGRRLVPLLVGRGFDVAAMTRSQRKEWSLRESGAEPWSRMDSTAMRSMSAVTRCEPEVIVHEMTGLTGASSFRNFDREFALTNRLRTEGTGHLLEAARATGARRFVAQSYGNWNYERTGTALKTRGPVRPNPARQPAPVAGGIRHLEEAVLGCGRDRGHRLALRDPATAPAPDSRRTATSPR